MTRPSHSFRPRSASSLLAWALSASALLGLASCEGAAGDVCQLDGDCETGLLCCKGSASLTDRGTCAVSCLGVDAGPRDLGAADAGSSDLGAADAGEPLDLAMSVDLGADPGLDDAGAVDAGSTPADLGAGSDLGAEPDLGSEPLPEDAGPDDAGSADAGDADAGT